MFNRKKKQEQSKNNLRIDYNSLELNEDFMIEAFTKTDEGFLKGRAVVTNVGVFPYVMEDGSIQWELRPPEEVFNQESVRSLKMVPLTNDHPPEAVTTDNIKKYQIGHLGDSIMRDDYHLSAPIVITDEKAIEDVEGGKRAFSMGYFADLEYTPGVWMGVPYDAIQRNIKYNHDALVNRGRAGDAVKLKMDSMDTIGIQKIDQNLNNNKEDKSMNLKKIKIDGVEYEAEGEVIAKYTQATEQVETLTKDNSTLLAEKDQLKEDNEQLKNDVEEAKKVNPAVIEKAVQSKMVLMDACNRAEVEFTHDSTDVEIKKAVITKLFPNAANKLEKADESYIDARFDFALEKLDERTEERNDTEEKLSNDTVAEVDENGQKFNSDKAYQDMVKRQTNAWKPKEEV